MNNIKPSLPSKTLLSPKEVALQLGVSPVTVRYWAQENKINILASQRIIVHCQKKNRTGVPIIGCNSAVAIRWFQ